MQKTKLTSCLFFLFLAYHVAQAQYSVDSLKQVINSRVHDTTKLKAISYIMVNVPASEIDAYNERFKTTAQRILKGKDRDRLVLEKGYDAMATYHFNRAFQLMQTDYFQAIKHLDISLGYFRPDYFATDKYLGGRGNVLMALGVMYNKVGNTKQAIDNYFEALRIFEKSRSQSAISYAYQSIANLHQEQNKYSEALKYYLKAYDIFYQSDDLSYQDKIQKALLFISIGKCHRALQQCDLANLYLNKGLELATTLNDQDVLSEIYFNLGKNEEKCNQDDDKAMIAYQKSLSGSKLPENNANSLIAIGSVFLKQKKYPQAESNLRKGLDVAKEINHLEFQKEALENLYNLYKKLGKYRKALETGESYSAIKDSIKKEQNDNLLTKKQLQYEYEAKQRDYALAQERRLNAVELANQRESALKNNVLIGLSGALLLISVLGYFIQKGNKQKQALAQFEKDALSQKLLLSQMNPHFIFNSIDNIQGLIHGGREREATDYLSKFSRLTRQILENSSENYISLSEELQMLENYLGVQRLLYGESFDFKIDVDQEIDTEATLVPPMLAQPFIENAIKHGLRGKKDGLVSIRFFNAKEQLFFEVSDNGDGFAKSARSGAHKSMAMEMTRERLRLFAKKETHIHCENVQDQNGVILGAKVFFEMPYLYEK